MLDLFISFFSEKSVRQIVMCWCMNASYVCRYWNCSLLDVAPHSGVDRYASQKTVILIPPWEPRTMWLQVWRIEFYPTTYPRGLLHLGLALVFLERHSVCLRHVVPDTALGWVLHWFQDRRSMPQLTWYGALNSRYGLIGSQVETDRLQTAAYGTSTLCLIRGPERRPGQPRREAISGTAPARY